MADADYLQAVRFIEADIQREIQLAQHNANGELGSTLVPGGGNVLAALGLLCYTEFGGKVLFNHRKPNGDDHSRRNFDDFFRLLGPSYAAFLNGRNVYKIFRCGLAHEYYAKRDCAIYMLDDGHSDGIGVDPSGKYFLVVESYMKALLEALRAVPRLRRVRTRAYFLWDNRTGRTWWDPVSNWLEAEAVEPAG